MHLNSGILHLVLDSHRVVETICGVAGVVCECHTTAPKLLSQNTEKDFAFN